MGIGAAKLGGYLDMGAAMASRHTEQGGARLGCGRGPKSGRGLASMAR